MLAEDKWHDPSQVLRSANSRCHQTLKGPGGAMMATGARSITTWGSGALSLNRLWAWSYRPGLSAHCHCLHYTQRSDPTPLPSPPPRPPPPGPSLARVITLPALQDEPWPPNSWQCRGGARQGQRPSASNHFPVQFPKLTAFRGWYRAIYHCLVVNWLTPRQQRQPS